ncbi:MAG TPA: diguanylate cyclase regulator RdcB family protein [Blastocatellia bacterium]|nr:diguanylate cyclase regulator RdcB family protein [Blastocatellia bacterium]
MTTNDFIEDAWFVAVQQYHPQLTEKALIDLVNGLEVVGDHLRCRNASQPMIGRIWRALTGKTLREQYIIDINLKIGMDAVTAWLKDIQAFQAKSDLALAMVSDKLLETRTELGSQLVEVAAAIDQVVEDFGSQMNEINRRVQELEMRDKARNHLELLVVRSGEYPLRKLPPLAQVFVEIDELWWGDFGSYCRLTANAEAAKQMIELAHRKISEAFAGRLGLPVHEIVAIEELLNPLSKLSTGEGEVVAYLANYGISNRNPLMRAIGNAVLGGVDIQAAAPTLPLAISPSGVAQRLLRESRLATLEISR